MKTATPALVAYLASISEDPIDWQGIAVDLYTVTLVNGTIIRFCNMDFPVTIGGNTFAVMSPSTPNVPAIDRFKSTASIGMSTDKAELKIYALPTTHVGGIPILQSIQEGFFDGAKVMIERCIMPTIGDVSLGKYVEFVGLLGDITDLDRTSATIEVHALTDLLNIQMPRNLYQPGCRYTLFDSGCTLSKAAFTVTGAVVAGTGITVVGFPTNLTQPGASPPPAAAPSLSTTGSGSSNLLPQTYYVVVTYVGTLGESTESPESFIAAGANRVPVVSSPPSLTGVTGYNVYVSLSPGDEQLQNSSPIAIGTSWTMPPFGIVQGVAPPEFGTNGYFSQGVITFTSGALTGLSYVVAQYLTGGSIQLVIGTLVAPSAGDTFQICPGCDKSQSTCLIKFSNLTNFSGNPYIPVPETSI